VVSARLISAQWVLFFIATIAALLSFQDSGSFTAAMGILGAIAGYLFGIKDK